PASIAFELEAANRAVDVREAERAPGRCISPRLAALHAPLDLHRGITRQSLLQRLGLLPDQVVLGHLRKRGDAVVCLERADEAAELELDAETVTKRLDERGVVQRLNLWIRRSNDGVVRVVRI